MDKATNKPFSAATNCIKSLINALIVSLVLVTGIFITADCAAQSSSKLYLLALSKTDHTLAIVDPATFSIIARIPVGSDPHEVIASADGRIAYVSIYGGG